VRNTGWATLERANKKKISMEKQYFMKALKILQVDDLAFVKWSIGS
jgi:hypothetical protein